MRLGLLGCGSIGSVVARAVARGDIAGTELVAIADLPESAAARESARQAQCPFYSDVRDLLSLRPDLVVEAASQDVVRRWAVEILAAGADLMLVSVGALVDGEFFRELSATARSHHRKIYVPSGAVGGLDILKSASGAPIQESSITTTKPPKGLKGNVYLNSQGWDLDSITKPTLLFEGSAADAVRLFPQNVNVAATVSLAGIGPQNTRVRVVADPAADRNSHEIFVRGDFGEATVRLLNEPSPENPKTSYLASLSVIATLKRIAGCIYLGT